VLALSDTVIVAYQGEVSTPSARGERTVAELGELMAGHGIGEAA
jgi:general nucleoside transport system ATP-binding protein